MPPTPDTPRFAWTEPQRRVLIVLVCALTVFLGARYACNRMYVGDPQPERPPRYDELADRIDPNTADWQTLAALPGLGEKRAKDIVEFRERKRTEARDPDLTVFQTDNDLLRIRGIGVATVESIRPFLLFPGPVTRRSDTAPAL